MATKKNANSSKTARVLNMIAGDKKEKESDEVPAVQEEPAAGAEQTPETPAAPTVRPHLTPPILEEVKADDLLAQKIKAALEEEVQAQEQRETQIEEAEILSEPQQEAQPEQPISVEEQLDQELLTATDIQPPPLADVPEEPAAVLEKPQPAPLEEIKPEQSQPPAPIIERERDEEDQDFSLENETGGRAYVSGDLTYVNVMQSLVEEKVKKYMKLFGVCTCSRCTADVIALALTNLPSKYIVMPRGEVVPMLTVYENRYSAALIAQVMRACKIVMSSPRHKL